MGPEYLDQVFKLDDAITFKCSHPKDFNDPYEQFLTIDFKEQPGVLAFYSDVIGNVKQFPVTCFSYSPIELPMWAHYAKNLTGVVVEIDECTLVDKFPRCQFGEVIYRDAPDPNLTEILYRAHAVGKPRYLYFLQTGVFNAAYYMKAVCWQYEKEFRMVLSAQDIKIEGELMLVDIPATAIKSIICGPKASSKTRALAFKKSVEIGCGYFELQIGKSSATPYFFDQNGVTFIFDSDGIKQAKQFCSSCNEPLENDEKVCSWCQINDGHKVEAASRNIFRVLEDLKMLGEYVDGMDDIGRNK